jgi:hypothetical protein
MEMVWHDAIGMEGKIKLCGGGQEFFMQPAPSCWVRKERSAIFGAYGDEVRAAADVVGGGKAQLLFVDWHGQKLARRGCFVEAVL